MNGAVRSNGGREAEEEAEWLSVVPGSVIEEVDLRLFKCKITADAEEPTPKRYVCQEVGCIYRARSDAELKIHMKTHSDLREYHCQQCPYSAKTKGQLAKISYSPQKRENREATGVLVVWEDDLDGDEMISGGQEDWNESACSDENFYSEFVQPDQQTEFPGLCGWLD
uniref:C2H2-type domain-containing protein n=1 Tax=Rhodnius prolixus TaxID=13249 RepID=T1HP69_RHOPR